MSGFELCARSWNGSMQLDMGYKPSEERVGGIAMVLLRPNISKDVGGLSTAQASEAQYVPHYPLFKSGVSHLIIAAAQCPHGTRSRDFGKTPRCRDWKTIGTISDDRGHSLFFVVVQHRPAQPICSCTFVKGRLIWWCSQVASQPCMGATSRLTWT